MLRTAVWVDHFAGKRPVLAQLYTDLYTRRKTTVLPEEVQRIVRSLGIALQKKSIPSKPVSDYRKLLCSLPAASMPRAADELRDVAQLHVGWRGDTSLGASLDPVSAVQQEGWETALDAEPDLAWLLTFHGNGYARQAALDALSSPPLCPFEFVAVVYRLNDWVPQVRDAAKRYAENQLSEANPETIAESAFFLIPQMTLFRRWDEQAASVVRESIYQQHVLCELKSKLLAQRGGKVGAVLRLLLKHPDLDSSLEKLAFTAHLPVVRAIALETLLMGRAQWLVGYRREWLNKALGISRRAPSFKSRAVHVEFELGRALSAGCADKSSTVRRVLADFLVSRRGRFTPDMARACVELKNDQNAAVRSRIDFLDRELAKSR